jgi:streptomycin 6-kinase
VTISSATAREVCREWGLTLVDSRPMQGYLSYVWKVTRAGQPYALKLTVPSETFDVEMAALTAWDGRSMVRLIQHDLDRGAALLQWLDPSVSLEDVPLDEALTVAGELLTITPATTKFADVRVEAATPRISTYFSSKVLQATEAAVLRVAAHPAAVLVNHDLHYGNVIRDWSGEWVCIDPKPKTGPAEYAIAPLIWRRYQGADDAIGRLSRLCQIARLDLELARDWLLVRVVDYARWGLGVGLTTDPELCREIADRLVSERG